MDPRIPSLSGEPPSPTVDISMPNAARMYDYLLGGCHNFAIDRETAEKAMAAGRVSPLPARANRSFLRRAVRFMVEQGVHQFLDLGSGIPTVGNVHEIAQYANPEAHVVYVDNEPIAVAHARQLLAGNESAAIIGSDLRAVETILDDPDTRRLLDFDKPVGVLMVAVFHFIPDLDDPAGIIGSYLGRLRAGGYLALSHYTEDGYTPDKRKLASAGRAAYGTQVVGRSRAELTALMRGLEIVSPGVVYTPEWRPDDEQPIVENPADSEIYAVVARVPVVGGGR
ncbi:MAG TPA: SAM-dependent methyltransferase [Pseudonocardiaceae bacterium]|jgi:SAM-dependent methyltransferase|nr:SAM-dependent methyltransferase [Pseudonocardiaceae bacterium]